MSNPVDPIVSYIKDRITFLPWGIMPLILFFIGHGAIKFQYILLYNLLWGIFFFRTFDDYFCFDYDLSVKDSPYLRRGKLPLIKLIVIFGFLFLSSLFLIFKVKLILLVLFIILFSVLMYFILKKSKFITLISLLKYPMFLYMITDYTAVAQNQASVTDEVWIIIGSLFFIVREILDEFYNKRNIQVEILLIGLLIGTNLMLRFT
jgi:hypothetical protein